MLNFIFSTKTQTTKTNSTFTHATLSTSCASDVQEPYRLYTHVLESEKMVCLKDSDLSQSNIQSNDTTAAETMFRIVLKGITDHFTPKELADLDVKYTELASEFLENIIFLIQGLRAAHNMSDVFRTIIAVTRFFTKKSLGSSLMDLIGYFRSQADVQSSAFDDVRVMLDNYSAVKNSPVVAKLQKLCSMALSSCVLQAAGITTSMENVIAVYGEAAKQIATEVDFMTCLIDLVTFMVERLTQCWHTGSLKPFFHSAKSYAAWTDRAYTSIEQSQMMQNPELHGLTYHGFLSDLERVIEDGITIQQFSKSADKNDVVGSVLSKLRLVRAEFLTRKAAGAERPAPFAVLVTGGSGVGKSSFVRMNSSHFGKMFHLPEGADHMYTRTASDPFYSGWRSHMWAVLLDDIASQNPNKGTSDQTLSDLLQICNQVAFCPPQAELADKGKTPMRPEFVQATTNTEHLNAHAWFANPVAVRRRLPFIIEIKPKREFARDDAPDMLDGSKCPMPDPGTYPDLWNIKVSGVTVKTVDDNGSQDVDVRVLHNFTNVYNYFAWFSDAAVQHRAIQKRASSNDEHLKTVSLCPMCFLPKKACDCIILQTNDVEVRTWRDTFGYAANVAAVGAIAATVFSMVDDDDEESLFTLIGEAASECKDNVFKRVRTFTRDHAIKYMTNLGAHLLRKVYDNPYVRATLAILGGMSTAYVAYKVYQEFTKPEAQSKENVLETFGERPVSTGDEVENFYHQKNDYRAKMLVSEQVVSWRNLEWTAICAKFANSVVNIQTTRTIGDKILRRDGVAVCVGGRLYVTDNHNLPQENCTITITREMHTSGLTTNVVRALDASSILRVPEKELAFFQLLDSFDCRNITPFLPSGAFKTKAPGALISRAADGMHTVDQLTCVQPMGTCVVPQLNGVSLDLWDYTMPRPSFVGLCGSLLIVRSPTGPVVVGLHLLGKDVHCQALSLLQSDVEAAMSHFMPVFSPGAPMLESQTRDVGVVALHPKSVFRYIGTGSGRVFGQLTLPRAQPKTSVCATVFREVAMEEGYKLETGAPVMKGKKLWRTAVMPIVEQRFLFEESLIHKCTEAYVGEVVSELPSHYKAELAKSLDLATAINGMPGRKYVDSINRGTSAGFPWMCTKKKVTHALPADDTWSDPIDVSDEVKARMTIMMERYLAHELVAPVFTAHAKDEALSFAKIHAEKTRIMNGAPLDWSLLVRMVYLPIVRVIQKNKFLFESMPGAVAQSIEWNEIHDFVTHHGCDRMIAGDYKAYDKSMSPVFIMHGFKVLIDIVKQCGADDDQITLMWGIAYDISCSMTNFNGDLVQFLGSNPSGHPLTVIINCVVGCLYMRYSYIKLNPHKEVSSFRDNVRLITYGDDNMMSSSVDWFNHTSISTLLATHGVVYTMADKVSESVPFLNISKTTFLKRGWRFEKELSAVVCPIEHATLDKMMTTWVPSEEICAFAQGEEILRNVCVEYFWYGREIFEEKKEILTRIARRVIPEEYITPATFPTWETLIIRWKMSSGLPIPPVMGEEAV
jgi:hypothetical protein